MFLFRAEPEFVSNYKVLQNCMTKNNVEKFVDVDRLVKGRYQDNLEFMQWLKRFYELKVHEVPVDYDVQAVRLRGKGGDKYNNIMNKGGLGTKPSGKCILVLILFHGITINSPTFSLLVGRIVPKPRGAAAASTAATSAPKTVTATTKKASTTTTTKSTTMKENRVAPRTNAVAVKPASPGLKKKTAPSSTSSAAIAEINTLKASNEEANKALSELRLEMDGLEKERDFYFEKLRDVEILLQELEDKGESTPLCAQIFKILYATAEGFEQVEEESSMAAVTTVPSVPVPQEEDSDLVQPPAAPEDEIVEPSQTVFSMAVEQESY